MPSSSSERRRGCSGNVNERPSPAMRRGGILVVCSGASSLWLLACSPGSSVGGRNPVTGGSGGVASMTGGGSGSSAVGGTGSSGDHPNGGSAGSGGSGGLEGGASGAGAGGEQVGGN